jgi:HEAT repeat protein
VVASVAPLLLVAPPGADDVAASLLGRTGDASRRFALALSLFDEEAQRRVPTETLLALVDDRTPAAPLAARALLARDEERTRPDADALLRSDDPQIRFHAALGLGRSSNADAVGRLSDLYRFETDPSVRRAVVTALSLQDPKAAIRTLELAATLDPDRGTRSAARLALGGAKLRLTVRGDMAMLASAAEGPAPPRPTAVKTPSGLLLPVVLGPEGFVVIAGLPPGTSLPVAPGDERGKDQERGASGDQKDERNDGSQ